MTAIALVVASCAADHDSTSTTPTIGTNSTTGNGAIASPAGTAVPGSTATATATTRAGVTVPDCGTLAEIAARLAGDLADLTWAESLGGTGVSDPCLATLPTPDGFGDTPWPGPVPAEFSCSIVYPGTGVTRPSGSASCSGRQGPLQLYIAFAGARDLDDAAWAPRRVEIRPTGPFCPEPDSAMAAIEAAFPDQLEQLWGPCFSREAIAAVHALGTLQRDGPCHTDFEFPPSEWACPVRYGLAAQHTGAVVSFDPYFAVQGVDPDLRVPNHARGCGSTTDAANSMLAAQRAAAEHAVVSYDGPSHIVVCATVGPAPPGLIDFPLPTSLSPVTCTQSQGRVTACGASGDGADVVIEVSVDLDGDPLAVGSPTVVAHPDRCTSPDAALDALLAALPSARGLRLWSVCIGRTPLITLDYTLPDRTFGPAGPLTRDGSCWTPSPGSSIVACLVAVPGERPDEPIRTIAWFHLGTNQLVDVTRLDPAGFANRPPR